MEWIAHRAANGPDSLAPALALADGAELDVHLLRGRLEVRHSKAVWPLRIYWERGEGILADEQPADLASILAAAPDGAHLWFDLKAFTPRLTRHVLRAVDEEVELTMSSRSWWILRPARRRGGVRTFRSIGSRLQLWVALRLRHPHGVGIPDRFATPSMIERLRARSSAVAVWGVQDDRRVGQLRDLGVDVLIVDDLDLITANRRDDRPPQPGPA
jgi:hypothetical protein